MAKKNDGGARPLNKHERRKIAERQLAQAKEQLTLIDAQTFFFDKNSPLAIRLISDSEVSDLLDYHCHSQKEVDNCLKKLAAGNSVVVAVCDSEEITISRNPAHCLDRQSYYRGV